MFRIYFTVALLSCFLFSHHDHDESHHQGSTDICSQEAQSLNPHNYKACKVHHASSPEDIKKIRNIHSRFKAHLKRASVTPGTEIYDLVHHNSDHTTPEFRIKLAESGVRKIFRRTLFEELEAGALDAGELGLTEATAAEMTGLAVTAPEFALPLFGIALGLHEIYNSVINTLYHAEPESSKVHQEGEEFLKFINSDNHLLINSSTSNNGIVSRRIEVAIPIHCHFPIILNKLYLGNYSDSELLSDPTIQKLKTKLGNTLFQTALQNIKPTLDHNQQCNYQYHEHTVAPFRPIVDISNQTRQQNRLAIVIRPMIITDNNGNLTVEFLEDELILGASLLQSKYYPLGVLSGSLSDTTQFSYRGHIGTVNDVLVGTERTGIQHERKTLFTDTSLTFYQQPHTYTFIQTDITSKYALGDNVLSADDYLMGQSITLLDILNWSTNP